MKPARAGRLKACRHPGRLLRWAYYTGVELRYQWCSCGAFYDATGWDDGKPGKWRRPHASKRSAKP